MKKLKMAAQKLTFAEGCDMYPEYCRQRNLRKKVGQKKREYFGAYYCFFQQFVI